LKLPVVKKYSLQKRFVEYRCGRRQRQLLVDEERKMKRR
jgi:hypothetical protein